MICIWGAGAGWLVHWFIRSMTVIAGWEDYFLCFCFNHIPIRYFLCHSVVILGGIFTLGSAKRGGANFICMDNRTLIMPFKTRLLSGYIALSMTTFLFLSDDGTSLRL